MRFESVLGGDKLLGGPQAGIIVGKTDTVSRLKRHPLARALRVDKLTYAALIATLEHYRRDEALECIPVWQMISRSLDEITARAKHWSDILGGSVISGESTVGGGSLPGTSLPTTLLAIESESPDALTAKLRRAGSTRNHKSCRWQSAAGPADSFCPSRKLICCGCCIRCCDDLQREDHGMNRKFIERRLGKRRIDL